VNYLRWLWRAERGVARVLAVAAGVLLICAPVFAVSEIKARSTVQLVHAHRPAVIHLGAGSYDVSQDVGDLDFPVDATALTVTGPSGRIPVETVDQTLSLADGAGTFLGANDCYVVMSFTIQQAGSYEVTIKDRDMSGAWVSEPWATVVVQVFPWALGMSAALLAIPVCLLVAGTPRRRRRRLERQGISAVSW
jgi:hypothetical protein